ncbi:MAG TPA: hypothetical protein VFU15_12815, partial [Bacteroidia bacterium]|nr:hypothetical protein [Bacteroidia bacterium]
METKSDELGLALQQMQTNLRQITEDHRERIWLQSGKSTLGEKLRGDKPLQELAKDIIDFIVSYSDSQIGTMYVLREDVLR